jgi:radical SAM superfamily enzyme YgiQ (UPF0313 family)
MDIAKVRFIEPGVPQYKKSIKNLYTYNKYIRTPSVGLLTLSTLTKEVVDDTLMYSESISTIRWDDVLDADIVFIGIFTFAAVRGYEIARYIKENSKAIVVMGGLHASMNYPEAVNHCDYVLLGEGDETIITFIQAIRNDTPIDFPGVAYLRDEEVIYTGKQKPPEKIDTIPNRNLLYRYSKMAGYNTIWAQVHASRGCPHDCDYCAVVRHFGRKVRTRTPDNILEDVRQAIAFQEQGIFPRLNRILWFTDDNFFADRPWAISVLRAIIDSKIKYHFTVQARFEVGFDDEMLDLLKEAGFLELAMGIEFLEDEAFASNHKKSSFSEISRSVANIQKHGLRVRGLFIMGADNHTKGVGDRLANFVIEHDIHGVLIQSMYFVPGTPSYESHKDKLIHQNWSKYNGHVVHYPEKISPFDLQLEMIHASRKIYSRKRLMKSILFEKPFYKVMFAGEYFWQKSVRADQKKELPNLKTLGWNPR